MNEPEYRQYTREEMIDFINKFIKKYPESTSTDWRHERVGLLYDFVTDLWEKKVS